MDLAKDYVKPEPPRELSPRELATVLAALRYWQQDLEHNDEPPISEHFEETTPLTPDEIDELCERMNFGEVRQ